MHAGEPRSKPPAAEHAEGRLPISRGEALRFLVSESSMAATHFLAVLNRILLSCGPTVQSTPRDTPRCGGSAQRRGRQRRGRGVGAVGNPAAQSPPDPHTNDTRELESPTSMPGESLLRRLGDGNSSDALCCSSTKRGRSITRLAAVTPPRPQGKWPGS